MTQIRHHPSDAILMAHAAGTLPQAFDVLVATHVSLCDDCRATAGAYDAVGGALLDAGRAHDMAPGAFDATVARIAATATTAPTPPRIAPRGATFPVPLRDWVGGDIDAVKWRPLGGGVRHARLKTAGSATLRLLHIPAGTAVPDHGHRGLELTMVLRGAFRDADTLFARGDVEAADTDLHHHPIAEPEADCICLAATDAPLKFDGLLQRIAQPFLGI